VPKKPPEPSNDVPEWVVTYGDLMSLLLCFFILLSAFSELKRPHDYQKILESIREAMGYHGGVGQMNAMIAAQSTNNPLFTQAKDTSQESSEPSSQNTPNVTGRQDTVSKVHEGTKFVVGGSISFDPGSYALSEQSKHMLLDDVAPKIKDLNYKVLIRGHSWGTEDLKGGLDYMDLAYERAKAVRDFLVREAMVRPEILLVDVAGTTEPMSVSHDSYEAGLENRRVEIFQTEVTVDELHADAFGTRGE